MAMINPCDQDVATVNTGSECDDAMLATRMLFLMDSSVTWDDTDLLDFTAFLKNGIHAAGKARIYPLLGNKAPVRSITDANEADVTEQMEDGSKQFVRYGMYNRTFMTDKGGLCLAQHLMRVSSSLGFIEVDADQKVNMYSNGDGTYKAFPVNLIKGMAPELANLKTVYKNKLMLDYNPAIYIPKQKIVQGDSTEDILNLVGLLDTRVAQGTGTNSTTKIYVKVNTACANTDLVALYGTALPVVGNFVVKNGNGSTNTPSAAAVVAGEIELTGTFTTATKITVSLAAPSVLKAAGIEGYEGIYSATCAIP